MLRKRCRLNFEMQRARVRHVLTGKGLAHFDLPSPFLLKPLPMHSHSEEGRRSAMQPRVGAPAAVESPNARQMVRAPGRGPYSLHSKAQCDCMQTLPLTYFGHL